MRAPPTPVPRAHVLSLVSDGVRRVELPCEAYQDCIPVRQDYKVHLAADEHHGWSIRMNADGTRAPGGGMGPGMGAGG